MGRSVTRRTDHHHRERIARIMRRATTQPSTCWTKKIQHRSEHEATQAIRGLRRREDPNADGLIPYRCNHCRKWHTGHGLGP